MIQFESLGERACTHHVNSSGALKKCVCVCAVSTVSIFRLMMIYVSLSLSLSLSPYFVFTMDISGEERTNGCEHAKQREGENDVELSMIGQEEKSTNERRKERNKAQCRKVAAASIR